MAEFFEEIESERILVTDLLSVQDLDTMRVGDLIVVDENTKSVRFGTGSSGQILVTDSGTSEHIRWKDITVVLGEATGSLGDILYHDGTQFTVRRPGSSGQVLVYSSGNSAPIWQDIGDVIGFNQSGQILTSGPGGVEVILDPGTNGQVLTINMSGVPEWKDPSSGNVMFVLQPGEVRPRNQERTFANFSWDESKYGAGDLNLSNGQMVLYAKVVAGASAELKFERVCGSSAATLMDTVTINQSTTGLVNGSGILCLPLSGNLASPGADGLYALKTQLMSGTGTDPIKLYSFQLKYVTVA